MNIVGDPPQIDHTVAAPDAIVIGTAICIEPFIVGDLSSFGKSLSCSQNVSNAPELEPTALYFVNGQISFITNSSQDNLIGINSTVIVFLKDWNKQGPYEGTLTCVLSNRFGNDTETSLMLRGKLTCNVIIFYLFVIRPNSSFYWFCSRVYFKWSYK